MTCFISLLFLAQYINYIFYGNIISIYSIIHGGQVFVFFNAIIKVIKENIIASISFIVPIPILITLNKKITCDDLKWKTVLIKFIIFILIFGISVLSLNIDKKDIYSAKNLYYYKHVPNNMAKKFGLITTMRLDLERLIGNFEESSILVSNETTEESKKEYNKLDIDFNSLIENETDEVIKDIHLYMSNETASEKNEYTGMFKDKNLIVIVAEAFSPIAVDEELTPTLYKLVNTGFNFTNFYSPLYYVSTSDGEYVSLTSLLPKESVWSFSKSSKNYLPYTYGNIFKQMGYTTYAFHDGTYKYYNRNLSHPNMGYTYLACGNGLEKKMNCNKWPQSDVEMIEATFDYYADSEHFMTYYMSISGHLEYNFYGNNMAYKNKDLTKDTSYSDAVKAYISSQSELDKALESLINKLTEKGILDDTVIVLSADHYPYGLTNEQISEVMDIEDEKFDIHKNNLVIWNSQIEKTVIDKYAESLDILPTILNLFGIEYDSRLLMGRDILSDSDGLVILNDRSWITEYGKYDAATDKFTAFDNKEVSDDYVDKINTIVYNKFVISKNILETDYYKYVLKENN
jgi:phosphoglycerol transferase MdoB-like AlkP superfamily enzyme